MAPLNTFSYLLQADSIGSGITQHFNLTSILSRKFQKGWFLTELLRDVGSGWCLLDSSISETDGHRQAQCKGTARMFEVLRAETTF